MTPQFDGVDHGMEVLNENEVRSLEYTQDETPYWLKGRNSAISTTGLKRIALTIRRLQEEVKQEAWLSETRKESMLAFEELNQQLQRELDITRQAATRMVNLSEGTANISEINRRLYSPFGGQHLENVYDRHGNTLFYSSIRVFLENVKKFRVEWPKFIQSDTFDYEILSYGQWDTDSLRALIEAVAVEAKIIVLED